MNMYKLYSKTVISTIIASSLVLGLGSAVVSAAPAKLTQTARTEQQRVTGFITPDQVTVPRYAKEVTVTGTVLIDGPQLIVTIPGSTSVTVQKIADKTWTYSATLNVEGLRGDQTYTISAKTVYISGKPAGDTHTLAQDIEYKIHVPFITSIVAENANFSSYDRALNLFTLTYNRVENWSTGEPVITAELKSVAGTESDVEILGSTFIVPTAIKDITFPENLTAENYNWDPATYRYAVSFVATIENSKGEKESVVVTKDGLMPGQVFSGNFTVSDNYGSLTKTYSFTSPAAPVAAIPTVTNISVAGAEYRWTGKDANGGNVQAKYTLEYTINGERFTITKEFTFNNGVGYKDQNLTEIVNYNGQSVTINASSLNNIGL
jgi:hypothetical protein